MLWRWLALTAVQKGSCSGGALAACASVVVLQTDPAVPPFGELTLQES